MPVDFMLTPEQQASQDAVQQFAGQYLVGTYEKHSRPPMAKSHFQSIKPIHEKAVQSGIIGGQILTPLDGKGGSLLYAGII